MSFPSGAPAETVAIALAGLVFGLAQAAHCAGMCGVFALHAANGRGPLRGLSMYALGKTFTYVFLGALAGAAGASVGAIGDRVRMLLGLSVGVALVIAALHTLRPARAARPVSADGDGAAPGHDSSPTRSPASGIARVIGSLRRPDLPGGRFSLGALSGALPCGVVYLAVLQALALGRVIDGMLFMAAFGLGTLPALGTVALAGRQVLLRLGPARLRIAAGCVVLIGGLVTVLRSLAPLWPDAGGASCAFCP